MVQIARLSAHWESQPGDDDPLANKERRDANALYQGVRREHELAFDLWLASPLARQFSDLEAYINQSDRPKAEERLHSCHYRPLVPLSASSPEAAVFVCGLEANLALIRISKICSTRTDVASWRVRQVLETSVRQHGRIDLRLKTLAGSLRVSQKYLGGTFREHVGMPFRADLRRLRIAYIAEMLNQPLVTLQEVTGISGHTSCSNLVREFRMEIGVTPGEYRGIRLALNLPVLAASARRPAQAAQDTETR